MRNRVQLGLVLAAVGAALGLGACGASGPVRVYVEPTYEQDRLQLLLARHPEVKVLLHPGTEDVTLRVEGVPRESPQAPLRASLRARHHRRRYEVYAVAEAEAAAPPERPMARCPRMRRARSPSRVTGLSSIDDAGYRRTCSEDGAFAQRLDTVLRTALLLMMLAALMPSTSDADCTFSGRPMSALIGGMKTEY